MPLTQSTAFPSISSIITKWNIFSSGPEAEAHGRAADVGGVRPREQGADRGPDRAVGGQPGAAALRAVPPQVLHGLAAERGTAQSKGE